MEQLKQFLAGQQIQSILDIGTGSGDFIDVLAKLFPGSNFTGVDPSESAINEARQKFSAVNCSFKVMNSEHLEFQQNSFDMATLSNALHHLPFPEKSLAEMVRVVKPGGWLIINELFSDGLNQAQENQKLFHHHRSQIDRLNGIFHRETFTRHEIIELLEMNGIKADLMFEYYRQPQPETDTEKLEEWIRKMEKNQGNAIGTPEFDALSRQVNLFKTQVFRHGFQPATNLVVVSMKK